MKILLADDHELVRTGVKYIINSIDVNAVIIEVQNYHELITASKKNTDIDLILLDLIMPGGEGMDAITQLRHLLPSASIVVLSLKDDYDTVRQTLDLGVKGFIPKSISNVVLKHAIEIVVAGGIYIPDSLLQKQDNLYFSSKTSRADVDYKLTLRQKEILELLGSGKSNKDIGDILGLNESTIRSHLTALFKILKVKNRTEASFQARKIGLVKEVLLEN